MYRGGTFYLDKDSTGVLLDKLNDKDLKNFCIVNPSVCRESYFEQRTLKNYKSTISEVNGNWKQHYFEMSYYKNLLKEKYNYNYREGTDKNPKTIYEHRVLTDYLLSDL